MQHTEFKQRLQQLYPKTAAQYDIDQLVIPSLISPVALMLPQNWLEQARKIIQVFYNDVRPYEVSALRARQTSHAAESKQTSSPGEGPLAIPNPGHSSVLMSYDFHVSDGLLKLIEINTNASMSLLTDLMNTARGLSTPIRDRFLDDFETEMRRPLAGAQVVIVDENPTSQKLFIEFLLYRELFEARGARVEIVDSSELVFDSEKGTLHTRSGFGPIDLVYNRLTDFAFSTPVNTALRQAMLAQAGGFQTAPVVTPHPHEYEILANKSRLTEWTAPEALSKMQLSQDSRAVLQSCLLRTRSIFGLDPDQLWNERKKLIFKPSSSYGGKAVFRGSSISRGVFQDVVSRAHEFTVQDFAPAPTVAVTTPLCSDCVAGEFKYDLRFFAYKDELRIACARLYQGQFTNATTPGGGVTSIEWKSDLDPKDPVVARPRA